MPEFKNREEYEKWKAERIDKRQNNTKIEKSHAKNHKLVVLAISIPELIKQCTRIVFKFPATDEVHKFINKFKSNPSVPIGDYVIHVMQLEKQILALEASKIGLWDWD